MSDNRVTFAKLVSGYTEVEPSTRPLQLALFNTDGSPYALPAAATTATAGLVKKLPAQADSTAADVAGLKTDFNTLLGKLRTAGILTP